MQARTHQEHPDDAVVQVTEIHEGVLELGCHDMSSLFSSRSIVAVALFLAAGGREFGGGTTMTEDRPSRRRATTVKTTP